MIFNSFVPYYLLWLAPADLEQPPPCLSYHGLSSTGKYSFFSTRDAECAQVSTSLMSVMPVRVEQRVGGHLVWFEQDLDSVEVALHPSLFSDNGDLFERLSNLQPKQPGHSQQVLNEEFSSIELLYEGEGTMLVHMTGFETAEIDTLLPPLWKSMVITQEAAPLVPVPAPAVDRVRKLLQSVKFDPIISSLVNSISVPQMKKDITYLTGEDSGSPILSRHSFSEGIHVAAAWLKARFEETGASCKLKPFSPGFGPNIICSYSPSTNTTETVLLSAHYDSRGSFGSTRAPGGDDDGSGTVALLAIARAIARGGITFEKNVQLCAFAGEEQGLVGSRAYARELRDAGANLTLMVQADMLAYHKPGEPPQLGLPDRIGTPEVSQLVANLSAIYSPELHVGVTAACCSDHQSFHEQGFAATQVFERAGPIADPMYHNSGDLSDREGYDLQQVKSIAKVQFATLLHAAGFSVPVGDTA